MQKTILFSLFCLIFSSSLAQEWGIRAGFNAFAPIPTQLDSGAKGQIYPFFYSGIHTKWQITPHFATQLDINYNKKSASYEALIPQAETTVLVTIFGGQQQLVNASYRGDVAGKMNLHYIDVPLHLLGTFGRWDFQIGTYYSRLIAGRDTGRANIVIGNPGVEFSRDSSDFNNFSEIKKNTFGVSAGVKYQFPFGLFIESRIMRSFQSLYSANFMQSNPNNNKPLYITGVQVGLGYRWAVNSEQ